MARFPGVSGSRVHVSLSYNACISFFIASLHMLSFIASTKDFGSLPAVTAAKKAYLP